MQTIVILTPGFPESEADVNCLPMQQSFVKNLKKLHPELNIIVLSFQYPYKKAGYKWHDISVMSFDGKNKGGIQKLLLRKRLYTVLKNINSQTRITALLSFWYGECAWVGKKFGDKHNIKHYCWILGQDARKQNRYPQRLRMNANELIALSDSLQEEFEKNHHATPAHIIPPGIDTADFGTAVHSRNIDIIGVGSLIPLKQYDMFIRIVAKLAKKYPSIKAVICGKGPERKNLFDLISEQNLHAHIVLLDETDHAEVLTLMQQSKILLHTSSYEGFANVYSEALYAGAHVVGFCKPMNKIFDHQHVVQTEEEMTSTVDKILSGSIPDHNPVLTYSMEDTCKKMLSLFNRS